MNFISNFVKGRANHNTYILVGFFGSIILTFFVYNYHMEYLYSASSSDHSLLQSILIRGALLLVISYLFSFLLYRAIWLYKCRGGIGFVELISLACTHFLIFTLLSTLVIGNNAYRAANGLLTKEHKPLFYTIDD